jgi:haloalkane dehalogenase
VATNAPSAADRVGTEPSVPTWLDRDAYPFTSRWLDVAVDRNGARDGNGDGGSARLHYIDVGAGEPILFVHGTPTWSFEYRHLIQGLRPTHRCIAVDHLGFGLSERPADASYTPEAHARRLRAFVDRLGLERFTLVVHDFGGPIGLPLALDATRVARLVVLNSWMWSFADDAEMTKRAAMVAGGLGRFLYRRLNASLRLIMPSAYGDRRKLTRAIHRQYLSVFGDADGRERVLWALARALTGSAAHYDDLWQRRAQLAGTPALIVWGRKDSAFRPSQLSRWRQALPHATVVELPVAGHWPHEEAPDEVLAALRPFLSQSA